MSPIPTAQGPGHEMTLLDHLEELRARLIRCILAALVGFLVSFAFAKEILAVLLAPLNKVLPAKSQVIGTGLTEPLFVSMKAAFVAGLFLVSPYIFVQIWRFISPGLYEEERKLLVPVAFFTAMCFVSGACFGYFVVFPFGFEFLANYAADVVTLMPNLKDYYSFALSLLLAFGVIFELPVFIFFLARFGIVDAPWLREKRRWAIVIIFIVAAVLTPTPDVVNQLLMACPMVVLYEIGIWVAHFFGKRKPAPETENLPAVPDDAPDGAPASPEPAAPDAPAATQAAPGASAANQAAPDAPATDATVPDAAPTPAPPTSAPAPGAPAAPTEPAPSSDAETTSAQAQNAPAASGAKQTPPQAGEGEDKPKP